MKIKIVHFPPYIFQNSLGDQRVNYMMVMLTLHGVCSRPQPSLGKRKKNKVEKEKKEWKASHIFEGIRAKYN